jgi:GNAT superfamily N-acetyltransferase
VEVEGMIRAARPDDAPSLAVLLGELLPRPTNPDKLRVTLSRLRDDLQYHVLVHEEESGALTGTVFAVISEDIGGEGRPFMVMDNLVVAARARGQGVATALMEELETIARARDCALIMMVSGEQRAEAHQLYDRLGYTVPVRGFKKYL